MAASSVDAFELHVVHLRALAYRLTGSYSEADDILQEARLKWSVLAIEEIQHPRAYLSKVVSRLCLDWLKSARVQREQYVGPWLPEPILASGEMAVDTINEFAQDISIALMLTLERLSPLERAAFLLHDVFDYDYEDVAEMLGRAEPAVRQLAARGRAHVRETRPRHKPTAVESARVLGAFQAAIHEGDAGSLCKILTEDAICYSDGGGRVKSALLPIKGNQRVTRFLLGLANKHKHRTDLTVLPCLVNDMPGLVFRKGGEVEQTVAFQFQGSQISAIYTTRNPDKLTHLH